jgi:chemotaxis regulatin CheY-phosphate phosphatase CheZ
MNSQELEEFKELRDKALEDELTKDEVNRFVELTNMAIEACVGEIETAQEENAELSKSLEYVTESWKDIDLVNRIQNAFLEEMDLKEEFREFLDGYKEKSEETTEPEVIH